MKVTILLADSAQAVENKLYILGGGWSIIDPGLVPMAIAIKIEVPWDETNRKHMLQLKLVDSDGQSLMIEASDGKKAIEIEHDFEVARSPGIKPGTPIDLALAINFILPNLPPDKRFEWICFINNKTENGWKATFSTRQK